jgi:hypothetical protein
MAQEAGTTARTIKKWVVEKHRLKGNIRRKVKRLNQLQEDLIIGSILGDGHITNEKFKPIFIVSHAADEKDYLYWKHDILKDFCNKGPRLIEAQIKPFGDKEYLSQDAYRINTRVQDDLIKYRDMSIKEIVKKLNEFSFSIWLLDDGHRSSGCWDLCVAPYSADEVNEILNVIHERFKLECKIKSDNRYILFTAKSSRDLDQIILKNIPNELDVIRKKITEKDIDTEANYFWVTYNNEEIGLNRFCRENKIVYSAARKLYFEGVTDGIALIEKCCAKTKYK